MCSGYKIKEHASILMLARVLTITPSTLSMFDTNQFKIPCVARLSVGISKIYSMYHLKTLTFRHQSTKHVYHL